MAGTVLPTLHNRSTPELRTPGDIAAYLIRFMFTNPGRTSEHYEDRMVSFQQLAADYESDRESLAGAVQNRLQTAMYQYFPNMGISVSVRYETIEDPYYRLIINIVDSDNNPVMVGTKVDIQNGLISINSQDFRRNVSEPTNLIPR
jgi:hypothetical protein